LEWVVIVAKKKVGKAEVYLGWSHWDRHAYHAPDDNLLRANMQSVHFCDAVMRRECMREKSCSQPMIFTPEARSQFLIAYGVKPVARFYLGSPDSHENKRIQKDWAEVTWLQKQHFEKCRPIVVTVADRVVPETHGKSVRRKSSGRHKQGSIRLG
jgi:hypothetical protein